MPIVIGPGIKLGAGVTATGQPPPVKPYSWNMNTGGSAGGYLTYYPGIRFEYSPYTFECWFKISLNPANRSITGGPTSFYPNIYFGSLTTVGLEPMPGSTGVFTVPTISLNTWHNLVVVKTPVYSVQNQPFSAPASPGSGFYNIAFWLDGQLATSGVSASTPGGTYYNAVTNTLGFSSGSSPGSNFNGKLSSVRWSNICRYFPYTGTNASPVPVSTIPVPRYPYEADANTLFLLNPTSATPSDSSGNNAILANTGTYDPTDSPFQY